MEASPPTNRHTGRVVRCVRHRWKGQCSAAQLQCSTLQRSSDRIASFSLVATYQEGSNVLPPLSLTPRLQVGLPEAVTTREAGPLGPVRVGSADRFVEVGGRGWLACVLYLVSSLEFGRI